MQKTPFWEKLENEAFNSISQHNLKQALNALHYENEQENIFTWSNAKCLRCISCHFKINVTYKIIIEFVIDHY